MPRKLFLSFLALLFALPVVAQIAPIRIPVTRPVATNPDDQLRQIAKERNWRILDLWKTSDDTAHLP